VDLYVHSLVGLHDEVLNYLITGPTLFYLSFMCLYMALHFHLHVFNTVFKHGIVLRVIFGYIPYGTGLDDANAHLLCIRSDF
jgi:hypothetical protein